jgi:hypothetical protein
VTDAEEFLDGGEICPAAYFGGDLLRLIGDRIIRFSSSDGEALEEAGEEEAVDEFEEEADELVLHKLPSISSRGAISFT